ncbi:MAG TPA: hypothetical protein PLK28_07325 [Candidatus Rifleibacterium sp.]|jgi:hypothetical protein|nr:hypothetical protein [Candidatus Rifleibacterium sp.]HOI90306.1 hypothetical protein [Candidatus Rifleibacterium sp.]HPW59128.1 hypothetical protein [Candidatus Rifleibacterium sp.]
MPRKNRYKQLCEAYDRGVAECSQYQKECREFVQEIRTAILEYLNCPDPKLFMFTPSSGFVYNNQSLQGDALDTEFGENGTAAIGFAINVNDDDLQEKFFTFLLIFRKTGSKIIFNIDDDREFVNSNEGINEFCDYLFEIAQKNLLGRLDNFLQSPEKMNAPIGFRPEAETQKKVNKRP